MMNKNKNKKMKGSEEKKNKAF